MIWLSFLFREEHDYGLNKISQDNTSLISKAINSHLNVKEKLRAKINEAKIQPEPAYNRIGNWMKKDFNFYEKTTSMSKRLQSLNEALKSVKPTSVESERVFSTSGKFVAPLRNRLSDTSINALVFLKYYFQRHDQS